MTQKIDKYRQEQMQIRIAMVRSKFGCVGDVWEVGTEVWEGRDEERWDELLVGQYMERNTFMHPWEIQIQMFKCKIISPIDPTNIITNFNSKTCITCFHKMEVI